VNRIVGTRNSEVENATGEVRIRRPYKYRGYAGRPERTTNDREAGWTNCLRGRRTR